MKWIALVCGWLLVAPAWSADAESLTGRWTSPEWVTFTNPALSGSAFFLDIVIAKDGSFRGSWDSYTCLSYPGAYGTTISCSRVKKPGRANGKLNLAAQSGEIELERLGKGTFSYKLGKELVLELPKGWLKQGEPVLYTTRLVRPTK